MNEAALEALLCRYSVGPKHLAAPGPDEEQLRRMVEVALRAPDHGELLPFRFKAVRSAAARARMAALFVAAARKAGKDEAACAIDAERALQAPLTVAVIARIDLGHPQVPAHEQWACVGGAITNFLNAAQLLGFGGKMLSGAKVRDADIAAAFCDAGETLLGWIALGTPMRRGRARAGSANKGGVALALQAWGEDAPG
ncbi:nitroreductase [soil metagenome]